LSIEKKFNKGNSKSVDPNFVVCKNKKKKKNSGPLWLGVNKCMFV
jgi:hypothetical protein